MKPRIEKRYTAFAGSTRFAAGSLAEVAARVLEATERGESDPVLIFDDATGEQVDIDLRGSPEEVLHRLEPTPAIPAQEAARGPGRPKLGVVAREVTLLPRHWAWLNEQPGGSSVALRKLVEEARRANEPGDRVRRSRESAYRFLGAMAGDRPGFEEATRALFAGDRAAFEARIEAWPGDVRDHARAMAEASFLDR